MTKKTPEFALMMIQVFEDCKLCDFAMYSSSSSSFGLDSNSVEDYAMDKFIGCFFGENEGQTTKPSPNCRVRLALKRDKNEKEKDTKT